MKINKTNRLISLILVILTCLSLTSCTDETIANNGNALLTSTPSTAYTENKQNDKDSLGVKNNATKEDELTEVDKTNKETKSSVSTSFNLESIPSYSGQPYVVINNNTPYFTKNDYTTKSFERYANLDKLGRCGVTFACIGTDLMPTEKRGQIGSVKPSGWKTAKYDCVDGKYLYNRCHLIGFQLSGENANERNLITGTRYMNVDGMLPFENMVADYVKETNNHVLYRVTPIFEGNNLVATGVLMEAVSVEDNGDGICFNVFCYNAQPNIKINYMNGESSYIGNSSVSTPKQQTTTTKKSSQENNSLYVLNTNSKKFHYSNCPSAKKIADKNKQEYKGNRSSLISDGYVPCKSCNP